MVERPGKYNIKEGDKLSSLIARAGGYKKGAYSYGAALFRDSATDNNVNSFDTVSNLSNNKSLL